MKRAVIELQFNWIFVLIVGTIILVFFIGIVQKQKDISESKIGVKLAADLETITTGAEVSKGTAQIIKIPGLGIEFNSEDCLRTYTIGGGSKLYREKIIFAPSRIEGREILAWTLDWNVPYRITNFLFVTSPQMRYILVDPTMANEFAVKVNKTLPDEMYKELIMNPNNIENQNNYKVRLIYFSAGPGDIFVPDELRFMDDKDVSALNIITAYPYETGSVQFYEKQGPDDFVAVGSESYLLMNPSVYGAIFTDDYGMYNCNMREAFRKMHFLTNIYVNRTQTLYNDQSFDTCDNDYLFTFDPPGAPFKTIMTESQTLASTFPIPGISDSQIDAIYAAAFDDANGLENYNGNIQLHSCPEIY